MERTSLWRTLAPTHHFFLSRSLVQATHARTHADTTEHEFTYWDHSKNQKDVHPFTLLGTLFKPMFVCVCALLIFIHTRMLVFHCILSQRHSLVQQRELPQKTLGFKNTHSHLKNSIFLRWPSACRQLVSVNAICLNKELSFTSLGQTLTKCKL